MCKATKLDAFKIRAKNFLKGIKWKLELLLYLGQNSYTL